MSWGTSPALALPSSCARKPPDPRMQPTGRAGASHRSGGTAAGAHVSRPLHHSRVRRALPRNLFRRLRSALSPVSPDQARRYELIDRWIAHLSLDEAREVAQRVLENPEWFHTVLGNGSAALPADAPVTAREFYGRYVSATGRYCDLQLVAADCAPSAVRSDLLRVGRDDAHVELCTRGWDDRVFLVANDVGPEEAIEGSVPTLYHAVVRAAAVLEYVSGPSPA